MTLYKEEMLQRHHLHTLLYAISPNDVYLYEDQLMININVFSLFDDEGRARHPLVISRTKDERVVNLLYWNYIMHQPIASSVCLKILRNKMNESIFACGASVIFHWRKFSRDTKNFALVTSSCRCFMCYQCQALKQPKSNSTSTSIVLRHHL